MEQQRPYLSVNEVAGMLGVDPRTVHRLIREDELVAHRIGKEYRINRDDFDRYMKKTRTIQNDDLVEMRA